MEWIRAASLIMLKAENDWVAAIKWQCISLIATFSTIYFVTVWNSPDICQVFLNSPRVQFPRNCCWHRDIEDVGSQFTESMAAASTRQKSTRLHDSSLLQYNICFRSLSLFSPGEVLRWGRGRAIPQT